MLRRVVSPLVHVVGLIPPVIILKDVVINNKLILEAA